MYNEDMLEVSQSIKAAEITNNSKIIFVWKEIHIKVIDAIKGNSTWEFNPAATITDVKHMLKDNNKL
jgi:hypothetical protein